MKYDQRKIHVRTALFLSRSDLTGDIAASSGFFSIHFSLRLGVAFTKSQDIRLRYFLEAQTHRHEVEGASPHGDFGDKCRFCRARSFYALLLRVSQPMMNDYRCQFGTVCAVTTHAQL